MDYIENLRYEQLSLLFKGAAPEQEYLLIPSSLTGFHNTDTTSELLPDGRKSLCMNGTLSLPEDRTCPFCGKSHLHINQRLTRTLKHLPVENGTSVVSFQNVQYLCMDCGRTHMQEIPFKSAHHSITQELEDYICFLLAVFCQADFPIFVVGIPHRHRGKIPTFSGPCQEACSTTASCRMRACSIR